MSSKKKSKINWEKLRKIKGNSKPHINHPGKPGLPASVVSKPQRSRISQSQMGKPERMKPASTFLSSITRADHSKRKDPRLK